MKILEACSATCAADPAWIR